MLGNQEYITSENGKLLRAVAEATVDKHPEWLRERVKEDKQQGKKADKKEVRNDLLIGVLVQLMRGEKDIKGWPNGATRKGGCRERISKLTAQEIREAVHYLSKKEGYKPAIWANIITASEFS